MGKQIITSVKDNLDKQRTYAENIKRYNLAMKHGFYLEALLIDYAIMEDRLRSFLYYIGALNSRDSHKVDNGKVKKQLRSIVSEYKDNSESDNLGISSISGKMKIVRCSLNWSMNCISAQIEDKYLLALKSQYEGRLDIGALLECLDEISKWCVYRNEVIHSMMNKNIDSLDEKLQAQAIKGMELARFLDNQVKLLKSGNKVRKSIGFKK